jgi:hypothetical protein
MWPERVVLPAPAISQELSLGSRGEQLGVEELIPESAVKRFGKGRSPTVIPARCRPCWWWCWHRTSPVGTGQ